MKPSKYPLVYLVWRDARTPEAGGWITPDLVRETELVKVKSVGWLVLDRKDRIAIATCYQPESKDVGAVTIIPRGWIEKLEILKKAKD